MNLVPCAAEWHFGGNLIFCFGALHAPHTNAKEANEAMGQTNRQKARERKGNARRQCNSACTGRVLHRVVVLSAMVEAPGARL